MSIKILIGADIAPTKSNIEFFEKGDGLSLVGKELHRKLSEADFTVLNLEVPLTDWYTPIIKAGEAMIASTTSINGLKAINSCFFGIANNHILDQGEQGLYSTIRILKENQIAYAGAGSTPEEASEPYIADIKGVQVGIYACAEHEYSIVSTNHSGANPYDPLFSFDHVRKLKEKCDLAIVLYHGGKEYYRYPTPDLQRVFHRFAEAGANVVIAQHTHCIGCKEVYKGALLVYGQGNFLFDDTESEMEKTSLLVEINSNGKNHSYTFIPVKKEGNVVRLAEPGKAEEILEGFTERSAEILQEGLIEKKFEELAKKLRKGYLSGISGGYSRFFPVRVINKLINYELTNRAYKGKNMLPLENYINCEAHRELVLQIAEMERYRK